MVRHFPQIGASADFAWAGPGRSTDQRNKFRVNYDECRVNGQTIRTGDFVLLESDGVDCVCQVQELFDPGLESSDRSPSATVQWYWQLDEFRAEKRIWRKIESMECKPHVKEVFLDASNMIKEKQIELETIKNKCYIIGFSVDFDLTHADFDLNREAAVTLNVVPGSIRHPVFPCRFRRTNDAILPLYTGNMYNDDVFQLPPLNATDNAQLLVDRRATPQRDTPSRRRRRSATPSRGTTPTTRNETPTRSTRQTPTRRDAAADNEAGSTTPQESTSKRATPRSASTSGRGTTPSRSRASPRVLSKAFEAMGPEGDAKATESSVAPKIVSTAGMTSTMMDRMKLNKRTRASIGAGKPITAKDDLDATIAYKSGSSVIAATASGAVAPLIKGRKLTLGSSGSTAPNFAPLPPITLVKDRTKSTPNAPFFTRKADTQNCLATRKLHTGSPMSKASSSASVAHNRGIGGAGSPPEIVSPGRKLDLVGAKPSQRFKANSVVEHLMSDSDEENNNVEEVVVKSKKPGKTTEVDEDFLSKSVKCLAELQNRVDGGTNAKDVACKSRAKPDPMIAGTIDANASPRSQRMAMRRVAKSESSRLPSAPLVVSHLNLGDFKDLDEYVDAVFDSPQHDNKRATPKKREAARSATPKAEGRRRTPSMSKTNTDAIQTTPTKEVKVARRKSVSAPTTPARAASVGEAPTTPTSRRTLIRGRGTPSRRLAAEAAVATAAAMALAEEATPEKLVRTTPSRRKVAAPAEEATPEKRVKDTPSRSRGRSVVNYVELTPSPVKRPRTEIGKKDEEQTTPVKMTKRETPSKKSRKSVTAPASPSTNAKAVGMTTPKRNPPTPSRRGRDMTPGTKARTTSVVAPGNQLEAARARLHVSAVPDSLPCRDNEFTSIFNFVRGNLTEGIGGCMYVSGVPGTGKTATVREVMRAMEEEKDAGRIGDFLFIDINGMRLTDPRQAYVAIYKELTNAKATADHACNLLDKRFSTSGPRRQATVLLVDELDLLMTPKQDVLYNIFDWPSRQQAKLTVLAIANTMDLPERVLMNRVSSRLGLTRLIFQPYTFKQLQEIVVSRTTGLKCFSDEAIQFAARKVAAVSGDARRALDICRRSTEIAERETMNVKKVLVSMGHVQRALDEMYSSPLIVAIKSCSVHEQILLRAIVAEFRERGVEDALFHKVYDQHVALCRFEGIPIPSMSEFCTVCNHLNDCRLLLLEPGKLDLYRRVRLNISIDDVNFALRDVEFNLTM